MDIRVHRAVVCHVDTCCGNAVLTYDIPVEAPLPDYDRCAHFVLYDEDGTLIIEFDVEEVTTSY